MKNKKNKSLILTVAFFAVLVLFSLAAPAAASRPSDTPRIRPIIYFHGGSGSAAQFETQAMRFASNGYPPEYLTSFEYSTAAPVPDKEAMNERIDAFIDDLLAKTGAKQVDIMAKTWPGAYPSPAYPGITMEYMASSPERAAKIAHACYNDSALSGYTAIVPTLAIWGELGLTPGGNMIGAENVTLPSQTHVQTDTSTETFKLAYEFFTGTKPKTTDITPESNGKIRLAGKAVLYQSNEGVQDASLEIWKVDGSSGNRSTKKPEAIYQLSGDGSWGPFNARAGVNYEFAVVRADGIYHFYYEPFIRSDYLIRLTTLPVGGGIIGFFIDKSDRHSGLAILRNKEFLGDQGANNDILKINGINVATAALCPLSKNVIGLFAFDRWSDGVSDLSAPLFPFNFVPFLTAADFYLRASDPPKGVISLELTPRGGDGEIQVINIPNWPSSKHFISVQLNDYLQKDAGRNHRRNHWPP
ncbi:MAG: hypothetical protein A2W01_03165 [Candidatus Solincola sediminis]|nr:MAG: hypothetical protein A2W01_03165 [Candidatus Solincola sediminis]